MLIKPVIIEFKFRIQSYEYGCGNSYGQADYLYGGLYLVPDNVPVGGEKKILKHGSVVYKKLV
jgi:hypothetical protein